MAYKPFLGEKPIGRLYFRWEINNNNNTIIYRCEIDTSIPFLTILFLFYATTTSPSSHSHLRHESRCSTYQQMTVRLIFNLVMRLYMLDIAYRIVLVSVPLLNLNSIRSVYGMDGRTSWTKRCDMFSRRVLCNHCIYTVIFSNMDEHLSKTINKQRN